MLVEVSQNPSTSKKENPIHHFTSEKPLQQSWLIIEEKEPMAKGQKETIDKKRHQ